jgi:class 3 adenylate cyclase
VVNNNLEGTVILICPACQQPLPETNRFCGQCGLAIIVDAASKTDEAVDKTRPGRRYVTALFIDIVGSTQLVKTFDPEELQRIMQVYQKQSEEVINDFGGRVIEVQGDGIVAIFSGQENATESAVRAAYDLVQSILQLRSFGSGDKETKLQTRIGIATGEALVQAATDNQFGIQVLGTPNYLASRLQGFAKPNEVVVCPETYRRTNGFFEYTALSDFLLKGFKEVDKVWKVEQANDSEIRFEARNQVLTPLVGRKEVIDSMLNRWGQALQKHGQVVILRGEAGIGKSRVIAEFVQRVNRRSPAHMKLNYQCSQFAKEVPLYPVMKQITMATDIKRHDAKGDISTKLVSLLSSWQVNEDPYKNILMPLVHNSHNKRGDSTELSESQISSAIKACTQLPIFFTFRAPVLVVIEDMHFSDEASKALLMQSIRRAKRYRIMIVVTTRPDFEQLDSKEDYVTEVPLKRLAKHKALELLQNVKFDKQLPDKIRHEILDKCDGVPLHLEEMALHIGEHLEKSGGEEQIEGIKTPATLFDSFIERFDRYPESVQMVARAAAAIGREFDHRILAPVLESSEESVSQAINALIDNEQIYPSAEESNYFIFKHALLRDAIYDNTLNQVKYKLHKSIVEHLSNEASSESILTMKQIDHHQKMLGNYAAYG